MPQFRRENNRYVIANSDNSTIRLKKRSIYLCHPIHKDGTRSILESIGLINVNTGLLHTQQSGIFANRFF